jgi:hypothetical protein
MVNIDGYHWFLLVIVGHYWILMIFLMELEPSFSSVLHWHPLRSINHQEALIHPHLRPGGSQLTLRLCPAPVACAYFRHRLI